MHQWRVISIVVVTLVNFHAIFMCLEIFYQSNLPFTNLDFTQSGINSLETTCILSHILAWGKVQIGSNQVRNPHCRALKYDTFGQKLSELNWSLLFTEKLCEIIFLRQIAVTEYFRLFLWWRKGSKHCLSLKTGRCLIRSGKGEERTLCDKTKPGLWRGLQERLEVALIQFIFADNYSDISWSRPWNIFLSLF